MNIEAVCPVTSVTIYALVDPDSGEIRATRLTYTA
jgi:hypothetical protein